ncbi:uncharacterized protein Z518_07071 [Rhinocladiella mackenziei CBS 650.93]|uniref:CENP-V/GFA domain-containing protein n=1 Tax=Rhinocladiella mackenziei CBS 650.93 TaxID=1442369 RepID=A0A0D2GZE7_9EURO|nr:uncharacterized protein Z518_07071 [Rhinocladiella mackenziei CBS 650.93]KIX03518.1 hypothetical protein Z518_07071 [Rhinocladiella mackenziei CBS 650.93]
MPDPSHLACHCGLITEPTSLLLSPSLPIECSICHCNICRHTTGALGAWYVTLKDRPSEESMSNAASYKASEKYTRYFCKGCGCNVFVRSERDGRWLACAGVVEFSGADDSGYKNVAKVMFHEYMGDATDGGIGPYLTRLGGRDVPCYVTEPHQDAGPMKEGELLEIQTKTNQAQSSSRGDMMEVACHCGGVQLRIAPPPYSESSEGWHVPVDHSKYYARICCCRSCRLTIGFSMQPWTYIPPSQIFTVDGKPVVFGPKAKETAQMEKLKHYQSSVDVLRSFCTTCGASIFYQCFDRPYIIDVSVGVVRSKFGNVLAREWLAWDRDLVSKRNEAVDEELVDAWLRK